MGRKKGQGTRKINKLTVNEKTYTGDSVPDGFYDSLLGLKTFERDKIQDPVSFMRCEQDYQNIIDLCSSGAKIPMISLESYTNILKLGCPNVNDYHSITATYGRTQLQMAQDSSLGVELA